MVRIKCREAPRCKRRKEEEDEDLLESANAHQGTLIVRRERIDVTGCFKAFAADKSGQDSSASWNR